MSAVSTASSTVAAAMPAPSAAANGVLSSFDLLVHSCTLLSLTDLMTLTAVSRFLHAVADSDQLWRPRLQAATQARHTKPVEAEEQPMAVDSEQKDDLTIPATTSGDGSSSPVVDEPIVVCACAPHQPTSCKAQYLARFQCTYHPHSHCYRLAPPAPLLLVSRSLRSGLVAHMRARPQHGSGVPASAGELHCVGAGCGRCVGWLACALKEFYDVRSEWAGSFTMTPLSVVPVPRSQVDGVVDEGLMVADVRYWHVGGYDDVDHRRFTFVWRGNAPRSPHLRQQPQPTSASSSSLADSSQPRQSPHNHSHLQQRDTDDDKAHSPIPAAQPATPSPPNQPNTARPAQPSPGQSPPPSNVRTAEPASDGSASSDSSPWHVASMAAFCSGKWAFHSPANVVVTDALRYSRLQRAQRGRQRGIAPRAPHVLGPFAAVVPARRRRDEQSSG